MMRLQVFNHILERETNSAPRDGELGRGTSGQRYLFLRREPSARKSGNDYDGNDDDDSNDGEEDIGGGPEPRLLIVDFHRKNVFFLSFARSGDVFFVLSSLKIKRAYFIFQTVFTPFSFSPSRFYQLSLSLTPSLSRTFSLSLSHSPKHSHIFSLIPVPKFLCVLICSCLFCFILPPSLSLSPFLDLYIYPIFIFILFLYLSLFLSLSFAIFLSMSVTIYFTIFFRQSILLFGAFSSSALSCSFCFLFLSSMLTLGSSLTQSFCLCLFLY